MSNLIDKCFKHPPWYLIESHVQPLVWFDVWQQMDSFNNNFRNNNNAEIEEYIKNLNKQLTTTVK